MNTTRVYDVSTRFMLVVVLTAIVAMVMAIYSPSYAMFQSEIYGAWLVAFNATALACYTVYRWVYGTKVQRPTFS